MAEVPLPAAAPLAHLPAEHPAQVYAALPARELMQFIQMAGEQRTHPETQVIFTAFYHKYYPYLVTVASNSLGFIYDRDALREIVDDALAAFFRTCGKFNVSLARDDAGCDQLIRSYLGRLAKWKAADARSFQKSLGADVFDHEEIEARLNAFASGAALESPRDQDPPPEKLRRVSAWIDSLRELDRDVLRTYFLDDHPGQKSDRLPDGIARRLAEKHRTTTSNIRHLKSKLQRLLRDQFQRP